MTGKVKDFYHEEICSRANDEPWGPEPDPQGDLESLKLDADRAQERYEEARRKAENRKRYGYA